MMIAGMALKTVCGFVFDNPLGKMAMAGVLALGTFSIWLWQHDNKIEANAKTEIIGTLNTEAETMTDDAIKARAPAERPGAAERLRRKSCSDCDGKTVLSSGEKRLH